MFNIVQLKPFLFGALAIGAVWFGIAFKGNHDNLKLAQLQIDSARVQIHLAKEDIEKAKMDIDLTRTYLTDIRKAASDAKDDLSRLQEERNKIYQNIDRTIEISRIKLKEHQESIDGILSKQRVWLDSLNAISLKNVIIESSKTTVKQ